MVLFCRRLVMLGYCILYLCVVQSCVLCCRFCEVKHQLTVCGLVQLFFVLIWTRCNQSYLVTTPCRCLTGFTISHCLLRCSQCTCVHCLSSLNIHYSLVVVTKLHSCCIVLGDFAQLWWPPGSRIWQLSAVAMLPCAITLFTLLVHLGVWDLPLTL